MTLMKTALLAAVAAPPLPARLCAAGTPPPPMGGALEVTRDPILTVLRLSVKAAGRCAAFLQAASQASGRPIAL